MTKEENAEMTNDEYKEEIMKIQRNMLDKINENYLLRYWFLYLKEQERLYIVT